MIEARNFQFLVMGLSAAWLIVIGYMFYLVRRDKKLTQELSRLRDMLSDREKSSR
jgi:CcmD family protein